MEGADRRGFQRAAAQAIHREVQARFGSQIELLATLGVKVDAIWPSGNGLAEGKASDLLRALEVPGVIVDAGPDFEITFGEITEERSLPGSSRVAGNEFDDLKFPATG